MATGHFNEDLARLSRAGRGSSPSDGDLEHRTVPPRGYEAQALHPSSPRGTGPEPWEIVRTQNSRAVGDNALRFISASISDDLSQREKVEARQFSALMQSPPSAENLTQVQARQRDLLRAAAAGQRDTRAQAETAAQDRGYERGDGRRARPLGFTGLPLGGIPPGAARIPPTPLHNLNMGWKPVPFPPRSIIDQGGTRTGPQPYIEHVNPSRSSEPGDGIEPEYAPETCVDPSHVQQKARKRSRSESELTTGSGHLPEDLLNLDVHELEDLIEQLDQRAEQLGSKRASASKPLRYEILYRIAEVGKKPSQPHQYSVTSGRKHLTLYFDPPKWTEGQGGVGVLQSQLPVMNFDLYLEQHKDIAFIVYKTYGIPHNNLKTQNARGRDLGSHGVSNAVVDESIQPVSEALVDAVGALLGEQEEYASILERFEETSELLSPYLFVFHQRNEWEKIRLSLPDSSYQQLTMMWDYIVQSQGAEYAAADSEISIGTITEGLLKYLFKPGQLLVQNKDGEIQGWICADWPRVIRLEEPAFKRQDKKAGTAKLENTTPPVEVNLKLELNAWHWEFDGEFRRKDVTLPLSIKSEPNKEHGIPINTLDIFPLKYASDTIFNQLRHRGRSFWKCRKRALVSYRGDEATNDSNLAEERYMIDLRTYQILHKNVKSHFSHLQGTIGDTLPKKDTESDDPPDEDFIFLLPPKIKGFNLRTKKWFDLVADRISDVKWNKDAFSKVVIDRKAKDLIRALVSNQLESEKNTDLIVGKGNGLILLLHGGPGTGKTLTAESVAEIAEKPLYRVTCGDVGTKAEDVEKYLESVLYLGKLWGCVVLLDEADIFLQQRNLEDLQRNALVSVFLRVLEYYEGILVLTSNRVGTFDEAFKSRIQLALHYPALGPYQRLRIWENFFDRLDGMEGELIDLADLRDHLSDLKEEEMNGRQIRNSITTARQYAKWQNTTLTYQHLKDVIEVSGRFDKYLTKLHGGLTEGQLAEDEGLRLGGED